MGKVRVGNKQNSAINGEWAGHVRGYWKKLTSKMRRSLNKRIILNERKEYSVVDRNINRKLNKNKKP